MQECVWWGDWSCFFWSWWDHTMRNQSQSVNTTQRLYVGPGTREQWCLCICVEGGRSGRWYWLIETSYNLLSLRRDVTTSRLMFSHAGVSVQCVSVCPAIPQFMQWFPLNNITRNNIDRQLWTNNTFNYRFCQGKPSNICVVSRQADINSSGNWVNWRFIVLRERQWKPETVWSVSVCISVSMSWEISVLQPAAPPDTSDRV